MDLQDFESLLRPRWTGWTIDAMAATKGGRIAWVSAVLALAALGIAAWLSWPQLRFWWLFEPLGKNAEGLPEYRHRATGIVMVRLPGGTFWMGAQKGDMNGPNYDTEAGDDEKPVHAVQLSSFLIGKYELTATQWGSVMGPGNPDGDPDSLPVRSVSWEDSREFCRRAGLQLPTEAQWEYAGRGGNTSVFSFGSDPNFLREYAWFDENSGGTVHPGGQKAPNGFGLYDVHGNVFEWCQDVSDDVYYARPEASNVDPVNVSGSNARVARGGSYDCVSYNCRSASRYFGGCDHRSRHIGLRAAYYPLP